MWGKMGWRGPGGCCTSPIEMGEDDVQFLYKSLWAGNPCRLECTINHDV